MKNSFLLMVCGLLLAQVSFAAVLKGTDDQGKPCAIEISDQRPTSPDVWGWVRTNYSGDMVFELDAVRLMGSRSFVTASTRSDFEVSYYPSKKLFTYDEFRSNVRTGDTFFERSRDCQLQ